MNTSDQIEFNYNDNWLCYAFCLPTKQNTAVDLKSVIGFGDYIDHSIVTYEEITTSLTKLLKAGVIIRKDKSYCTSDGFNNLWFLKLESQKKKGISKVLAELRVFLNEHFTTVINDIDPDIIISKEEFRLAVDSYLNK